VPWCGAGRAGFAVAVHHHRSRAEAEALVAEIARAGGKAVGSPPTWPTRLAVQSLLPEPRRRSDRSASWSTTPRLLERYGGDRQPPGLGRAYAIICARLRAEPGIRGAAPAGFAGGAIINLPRRAVWT